MSIDPPKPIQLFLHPLSEYCRRVLYALSFKGVAVEQVEVDMLHPSPAFLEVSCTKQIPAARIWQGKESYGLVESLKIIEYVDRAYPGPPLYLRQLDGSIDAIAKALLDIDIAHYIDPLAPKILAYALGPKGDKEKTDLKAALQKLNDSPLSEGRNFAHASLGTDAITLGDIALLPFIELLHALKETVFADVLTEDFSNVWGWFARLSSQPWVVRNAPGSKVIQNELRLQLNGTYPNLTLPVTLYS